MESAPVWRPLSIKEETFRRLTAYQNALCVEVDGKMKKPTYTETIDKLLELNKVEVRE